MKRLSPHGFTLIEMVVVVAVIIVLAALTIGIAGYAIRKGNSTQAENEIRAIQTHCDAYKEDHGTFPQNADTDALDPRLDFDPASPKYQKASLHLYSCVTGDFLPTGAPDGNPDVGSRTYGTFPPKQLSKVRGGGVNAGTVLFVQDPFGLAYAYSTTGNRQEAAYRSAVRANPNAPRSTDAKGFNPTFDLWSTAGGTTQEHRAKWIKNWAE